MVGSQEDLKNENKNTRRLPSFVKSPKIWCERNHSFLFFFGKTIIRCEVQRFERHVFAPSGEANTIVFLLDAYDKGKANFKHLIVPSQNGFFLATLEK